MDRTEKNYIPALRFNRLTRFYDPLVRITTREFPFKRALLAQADLKNQQKILDLACGTGTLCVGIKKRVPEAAVFAFDVDTETLVLARKKASKNSLHISFSRGVSDSLPYPNDTFDQIFSTLSFHHLTTEKKIRTLKEVRRVLKPDGQFHLADYGLPVNRSQKILSNLIRMIDGNPTTADNLNGRLGVLLKENGFAKVERTGYFTTLLGTIRLFRAGSQGF